MKQVFKYVVPVNDRDVKLELHGAIVAIGSQRTDEVTIWAEHDEHVPASFPLFRVFGTGHPIPEGYSHYGTCQTVVGLVWHLYRNCSLGDRYGRATATVQHANL